MAQNKNNNKNGGDCCSFCGAKRTDVEIMFQGSDGANICNKCIENGYKIIVDNDIASERGRRPAAAPLKMEELLKPAQIKEFLDQYVIGQDAAKRYMSVAVYNHYKRLLYAPKEDEVEIDKSNIVLVGPTGTGKTLMARTIAKLLKVPFTIVDATVLTEAGYVGEDVESILSRLLQVADYNVEQAERGIVFIDEIDKIAKRANAGGADVSREGVQRDLLPLIEGCTVNTKLGMVKTDHILFIASGAFHLSKPSDLVPELQGRLPIRVELKALSPNDFERILTEPHASLTEQYRELLKTEGLAIEFAEDGIKRLAEIAWQVNEKTENIGARRLHTLLERLLEEVSFSAADLASEHSDKPILIDAGYVNSHLGELAEDEDLSRYIL